MTYYVKSYAPWWAVLERPTNRMISITQDWNEAHQLAERLNSDG